MIYDNIIKTIESDLDFVNKTNIIFLLILLIFFYYLKRDNYFVLTIISIIKKINNKSNELKIIKKEEEEADIIQISNNINISNQIFNPNIISNKLEFIELIKMLLINFKTKLHKNVEIFMRTHCYNSSFSVIKYSKKIKNIPNKFIILLNKTHINNDYITHIKLLCMLFPDHKHCIITNNNFKKHEHPLFEDIKHLIFNKYLINGDNIYNDITNILNDNEKIFIIIFPEGNIKRTILNYNFDINTPNNDNFKIIEKECFNYKNTAFEISIMNNIPILQTIFYSPIPNYKYTYFNKEYDIKHINHIGINVYNFQKFKKGITVENYRKTMEELFRKRYIETLINAHKFNIILEKKKINFFDNLVQ